MLELRVQLATLKPPDAYRPALNILLSETLGYLTLNLYCSYILSDSPGRDARGLEP
jgi:hypothetical protein